MATRGCRKRDAVAWASANGHGVPLLQAGGRQLVGAGAGAEGVGGLLGGGSVVLPGGRPEDN